MHFPTFAPPPSRAWSAAVHGRPILAPCRWIRSLASRRRRLLQPSLSSSSSSSATTMLWGDLESYPKVRLAVRRATEVFAGAGVPEPAASAEWLALHAFAADASPPSRASSSARNPYRLNLLRAPSSSSTPRPTRAAIRRDARDLSHARLARYAALCAKRAVHRTPVQYLVGEWDFHHDLTLTLRPPVLIPRPETEELVDLALSAAPDPRTTTATTTATRPTHVLDVGCGSGAILLALLRARPNWRGIGVDVSPAAIALSCENAVRAGVASRCGFDCADIASWRGATVVRDAYSLSAVRSDVAHTSLLPSARPTHTDTRPFDILVSNPPYIRPRDIPGLPPEVLHEDRAALDGGGEDGLQVVRDLLRKVPQLVRNGGRVLLELDPSQPPIVEREVSQATGGLVGLQYSRTVKDFAGRDRFCELRVVD